MPNLRYADGSPTAVQHTCGATHRPDVGCPSLNRWLVSGQQVRGLADRPVRQVTNEPTTTSAMTSTLAAGNEDEVTLW